MLLSLPSLSASLPLSHGQAELLRLNRNTTRSTGNVATALRPCAEPGCMNLAAYRGRCRQHERTRNRQTHHHASIYATKRWKMLRKRRLYLEPLCRVCQRIATDVDHVTSLEQGGQPFLLVNTQSLCRSCHGRKTRQEQIAGR